MRRAKNTGKRCEVLVKYLFLATVLMASQWGVAAVNSEEIKAILESQPNCGNLVRYDDSNLYQGFGSYRRGVEEPRLPIPGKLRIAPLDRSPSFELDTKDGVLDVVTEGASAYILTFSSIEEWDLKSRERKAEYQTYAIRGPLAYKEHAEGFARYKDKLIIAHGRLGISFFDMRTKRLTNQFRLLKWQLPLESMATGVTVQGNLAYVAMDNFNVTKPEDGVSIFRGIIVINMDTESVVAELGGMDPGADGIVSDSKKVIVSFGGIPVWKYGIGSLSGKSVPEPEYRLWKYPVNGHPVGTPAMDDRYYYTCFLKAPSYKGENSGFYKNIPMVLDRRVLMLN